MGCPGEALVDSGRPLSPPERLFVRARALARLVTRRAGKAMLHPHRIPARLRELVAARRAGPGAPPRVPPPLGLAAGERVRVKSRDAIFATLDGSRRCEGLEFMEWVMGRFCGRAFTVRKRVETFFDERLRRVVKVRNTVILDGVFCEPDPAGTGDLAGCQKTCFLFWKEAWLEREP